MNKGLEFIFELSKRLKALKTILINVTKEEELLKDNLLVKSGFILKQYSVRTGALNEKALHTLEKELQGMEYLEKEILYKSAQIKNQLNDLEKSYKAYHNSSLHLKKLFLQEMKNAFALSVLLRKHLAQIIFLLSTGEPRKGKKIHRLFLMVENMTAQILQFLEIVEQLHSKLRKFEEDKYHPSPRLYGRVMSKKEFAKMQAARQLSSRQQPTPVFDSPLKVRERILSMSRDERALFFRKIGVRSIDRIVFFQTPLKPVVGPVPQKNGLLEYKFPRGIPIELLEAA